jgi:signal transduction histidine kinase
LTSNKIKFSLLGIAFGLSFPIVGTALVCLEDGCPDGIIALHTHSRLMQIIDLAPLVLGIFSNLLGANVDKRLASERLAKEALEQKALVQEKFTAQLQAQNDDLLELNATMDGLVYTASHDLKTPIINFESMVKMLRMVWHQPNSEAMVEEILSRMEKATGRFHATIGDLLEVSRVERQEELPLEPVHLATVVQEIEAALQTFIDAEQATLQVELGDAVALGSMNAYTSIFQNLITNAIKYKHPERNPEIRISAKQDGTWLQVQFVDNGLGIDLEKHGGKMFKMFTRFQNSGEGTGIGLYIVKRTLDKIGGQISVESTVGKGTTFLLHLPNPTK